MLELPQGEFRAYIFDCDGTLVDSMPLHHQAWLLALGDHGADFELGWELFVSRAGVGLQQTVRELNRQFSTSLDPEAVVRSQRRHFDVLSSQVTVIGEVAAVARSAFGTKALAVASGGEKCVVMRCLERLGLKELFPVVVCQEDVRMGKPHPEMFLRCADLLGVQPRQCLVFEDGAPGVAAAAAAGMAWVRVPTPSTVPRRHRTPRSIVRGGLDKLDVIQPDVEVGFTRG